MYHKELQELKDKLAALYEQALKADSDIKASEIGMEMKAITDRIAQFEALGETSVEIARSFSFKLNVGNYESRDFFCSQKAECKVKDAEQISEALYEFCKGEVINSVNAYKVELTRLKTEGARAKEIKDIAKDEAQLDAGAISS